MFVFLSPGLGTVPGMRWVLSKGLLMNALILTMHYAYVFVRTYYYVPCLFFSECRRNSDLWVEMWDHIYNGANPVTESNLFSPLQVTHLTFTEPATSFLCLSNAWGDNNGFLKACFKYWSFKQMFNVQAKERAARRESLVVRASHRWRR